MTRSVTMVVERFWPAIGGVERHVMQLSQELIKRGWQVTIITQQHDKNLKWKEIIKGIEVHRIPRFYVKTPLLTYMWFLKKQHLWKDSYIVHIHDTVPLLFWTIPLIITRRTRPVSVTFHGYEHDPIPWYFRFLRRVARRIVGKQSLCIGRFIEWCYGIDCGMVTLGAVKPPRIQECERKGLVYVGRIEPDTGITEYIEAIRILREEFGIEQKMTVIGIGSIKRSVERIAEQHDLNIEFLGALHEPWRIAGSAKICLAVGFLSILEAMSIGIPVISLATSPLRAAYLKSVQVANGPISIQTSPRGVAKEIARLENNPALYQKIVERGKLFAERFSWSTLTEIYLRLWNTR